MNETDQQKAWRDFMYVVGRTFGLIWLAKTLPFMELKSEYEMRDDNFNRQNGL